ncbi:unnamed protein product [Rhizophagus irregularis]|nr:unnamed protein product [Rhizophagus irregularis]
MFPNILNNFLTKFQTISSSSTDSTTVNDTNTINVNTTSIFNTITYSSGWVEWSDDQIAALIEQRRSRNLSTIIKLQEEDQLLVIANDPRGARSRAGAIFFEVMNTRFWEKPDDQFVQASIGVNRTQRRRNRRNARGSRNTQNTNTLNTEDRNVDNDE